MINVNLDAARLRAGLEANSREYRNFARRTIFAAAHQAVDDIQADMRRVFDRPTRWVLEGAYVDGKKNQDSIKVAWKPGGGNKNVPAWKILRAQIEGGPRRLKKFERLLRLPSNRIAVPAKWSRLELDEHGNLSGGLITKIISDLRLFSEVGYTANRRNRSRANATRKDERYFMIPPGSDHPKLAPGIYRIKTETGDIPLMVIAFVRAGNYRKRFAPAQVVRRSVAMNIEKLWGQALTRTLPFRTARR
jgi:hypothetical protein